MSELKTKGCTYESMCVAKFSDSIPLDANASSSSSEENSNAKLSPSILGWKRSSKSVPCKERKREA